MLSDGELARIILAAREIGGPYGGIVEVLALTGQRREEVARCTWDEIDVKTRTWKLSSDRTKNAKAHEVYLSDAVIAVLNQAYERGKFVFSRSGDSSFQGFSLAKRELDELSGVTAWRLHDLRRTCVSGMARLGIAPHVADKVLNHQVGTISGVAAVYQRHDFLAKRREALETWGAHVRRIMGNAFETNVLRRVAFSTQIVDRIEKSTGLRITVHQFRHAAGALILKHRPGEYELVRRILGHKSAETTKRFYLALETTQASEIFTDIIRNKLDFNRGAA